MESTGARLKKIRLEKGISLEDVHKKTKIHLDILKAIEEDSLVNFSPIYIKGFLKIYCKFLNLDPREYIVDYRDTRTSVDLKSKFIEKETISEPLLKTFFLKLSLLLPKIKLKVIIRIIIVLLIALFIFNLGKFIFRRRNQPAKERVVLDNAAQAIKQKENKVSPAKQSTLKESKIISSETTSLIRLGIRAKDDCWVELKADGRLFFRNILKRGRFESWQAKDKIELSLGNAAAVVLEVNGKVIPALGRKGQAVKNIIITKEGLKTQR